MSTQGSVSNAQRVNILVEAIPYIQKYYNKIIAIKYGGNAMINEELKMQVMQDIVLLSYLGIKVVLIHGGGPEISTLLKKVGKQSEFVDGLRVTDRETVDYVQMALAGKVNKDLVNLLQVHGGKVMGISGIDGGMIQAEIKDERLGFVGEIKQVNPAPIMTLLEQGYIPVVSTLGCDAQGNIYNINADTAAAYIAGAIGAQSLIVMTDIAGILRDKDDPATLISEVTLKQAKQLFAEGIISGGMIPKVQCCIDAIHRGVERVFILDGRIPHSVLLEILTDEGVGTMFLKEETDK
ncbi:MAG TPA: acetylglutamate kinase [Clostridiales bacterium]|nr:acetylglutamate kinase [Clostridiales bacterium]